MSRMASFFVLVGIIIAIGVLFLRVMAGFLLPLFMAAVLVVIFTPLYHWMEVKFGNRRRLAAVSTTLAIGLIVLLPIGGVLWMAVSEGASLLSQDVGTLRRGITQVREKLGLEMPMADQLRQVESRLTSLLESAMEGNRARPEQIDNLLEMLGAIERGLEERPESSPSLEPVREPLRSLLDEELSLLEYEAAAQVASIQWSAFKSELLGGPLWASLTELANPTDEEIRQFSRKLIVGAQNLIVAGIGPTTAFAAKLVLGIVIMLVAVYFFLIDGPAMVETGMRLSPLDDRHEQELVDEFAKVSRAIVLATLLSALVQAILAGIAFWLAGLNSVFLLIVLTAVLAMIPFAGAATVWVPASLWLYLHDGRLLAAVLLAIFGVLVISAADNIVKPWVLHGQSRLHPLLALLSVLGGVQVLGPLGIVVGPMAVAFLQTLLNILRRELIAFEEEKQRREAAATEPEGR